MRILKSLQKIPGGLMLIPLLIGAIVGTFFSGWILGNGGMSVYFFTSQGTGAILAVTGFFIGTQLKLKEAPEVLRRGGVILIAKFVAGAGLGILINKFFGPAGILGISVLAIIACFTNSNGGMYLALVSDFGDAIDQATYGVISFNDGPFLTLLALSAGGVADIPLMAFLSAMGPLIFGLTLANVDKDFSEYFKPGVGIMLPIFAYSLGTGINLKSALTAGPIGIFLGVACALITGTVCFLADRYITRRPGYAGMALGTCAGNAVATPMYVLQAFEGTSNYAMWEKICETATAQIATAVVVTAILIPLMTTYVAKKYGCVKNGMIQADGKPAIGASKQ